MAYSTAQNPFYRPDRNYGGTVNWRDTPFIKNQLDPQIPEGVYTSFLGDQGLGGTDNQSTWAQGLYGKTLAGYKAAMRAQPNLSYLDYLKTTFSKNSLQNQYLGQTARGRGENPYAFSGPVRTIGMG